MQPPPSPSPSSLPLHPIHAPHLHAPLGREGVGGGPGHVAHEHAGAQHADHARQAQLPGNEGADLGARPQQQRGPGGVAGQEGRAHGEEEDCLQGSRGRGRGRGWGWGARQQCTGWQAARQAPCFWAPPPTQHAAAAGCRTSVDHGCQDDKGKVHARGVCRQQGRHSEGRLEAGGQAPAARVAGAARAPHPFAVLLLALQILHREDSFLHQVRTNPPCCGRTSLAARCGRHPPLPVAAAAAAGRAAPSGSNFPFASPGGLEPLNGLSGAPTSKERTPAPGAAAGPSCSAIPFLQALGRPCNFV